MSSTHVLFGLDAGASKTLLLAQRPGAPERLERRGPGANPNRIGWAEAADVLARLVKDVLQEQSNIDHVSLCAGVAGAGRPEEQRALTDIMRASLPNADLSMQVEVVHDAVIALDAAYGDESGIIVIAGTGSVVLGRTTDDALLRSGGWGHVLGDAGSGHALGRAGLRAVAEVFDGDAQTTLHARVRDRFDIEDRDDLLRTVYREDLDVAAVAPLVIEAAASGDATAVNLLDAQIDRLVEQVGWLITRAEAIAPRITLLGGMLQNEPYERRLHRLLQDRFTDWEIEVLQAEPVVGALRRARRLQSDAPE